MEVHQICNIIIDYTDEMLDFGKVIGENGSVLTHDSEEVIEFFKSDEVDIII